MTMYMAKMVKAYLPHLHFWTLSLIVNLLVLGIYPLRTTAQNSLPGQQEHQAANTIPSQNVESEILAEINRVRTNPQGYAHWLEDRRQYYDGSWIKLPGEKPVRTTSRGLEALDEAIAFLKEQEPLSPLSISDRIKTIASSKLHNFKTSNNIQYISYGRTTAKGIVMGLVVDERFPDRRRRQSLLSPSARDTGVVCKTDPSYTQVCAIAYSNTPQDSVSPPPEVQPETSTIARQSVPSQSNAETTKPAEESAKQESSIEASKPAAEFIESKPPQAVATNPNPPTPSTPPVEESKPVTETLPTPPQPQVPNLPPPQANTPDIEDKPEIEVALDNDPEEIAPEVNQKVEEVENSEEEDLEDIEAQESSDEDLEIEDLEIEDSEIEDSEIGEEEKDSSEDENLEVVEDIEPEEELEITEENQSEKDELAEASEPEEALEVAANSDEDRLLENVERGALETGDRTIEEDGSFYDSYPLEGKSGESFIIYLESEEFDSFVALIDATGNVIEQNDDISDENSNSRIKVTLPEDGVYNVIVNAYDKDGVGKYVLTVSR